MATDSVGLPVPLVMKASISLDIVNFVHTNMSKNSRQPCAVSRKAGHRTSAESWVVLVFLFGFWCYLACIQCNLQALASQADGFGRSSVGGLHGSVYHVNTLLYDNF
ncbi:hypothetical protein L6452_03511 [Arctium lappa]|uniref:Uncharacterized protein n=1 Tax=Arctium lappa TaxID=4217 RepID=A0ACB9FLV6_ARCLA|nr:hypothetical protein L6452_03511 [Arctium lappa]